MQRNFLGPLPLLAALVAISVSGCRPEEESTGSAQFVSRLQQALSASEVSRVMVTLTAADLPTRTTELAEANGQWGGLMGHIPAGGGRTFTAEAFRADGTKLYAGQVTGVTITKGQTTAVAITLQQVQAPPPFQNAVPIIDALVASGSSVSPGGRITLQASAHDPNPGDTLTYAWTASAGTLSSPTTAFTEWTAPQQAGPVTLTLAVTDPHGSVASLSLALTVRHGVGDAAIDIIFNNWPQVARITASPSRVEVGQTTVVTATASDGDGDELSYQWSAAGCTGTWTDATASTARFTPDAAPVDGPCGCRLGVRVGDGRGGTGEGTLSMCVGGAVGPSFAPEVVATYQSATSVPVSGTVRLRVEGQDPQGGALGFSWAASAGTLGVPASDAMASEVVWRAPACLNAGSASITVTLSNALGLTTSQVFRVQGLPECVPLPSGTWASLGSMHVYRLHHSATLLPSGKVLFTGGWGPWEWGRQADVYDPETHLSVVTNGGPEGMTTAVVLRSGKVLAIGSFSAALYEPVTNNWTSAGAVASAEFHAAALLPSGKVLLAGGKDVSAAWLATARLYDEATGTWTDTQAMLSARSGHTATLLPSGKVLVTGGGGAGGSTLATTELYDPVTGSWSPSGSMAFSRSHHTATLLPSGKVLIVGGKDGSGGMPPAEMYDPETDTWLPVGGSASTCVVRTATVLLSGQVLVTGCQGPSGELSTADVYDPAAGTWTPAGSLELRRNPSHTATLLPSGKVLVAGDGPMLEEYDPVTGDWTRLGPHGQPREDHTAVLLPSGKVLVVGGYTGSATLATSEVYDPATALWATTGSMGSPRKEHTATLLPSGKVLVVGGVADDGSSLQTAEVYDPATGAWTPTGSLNTARAQHTATLLSSGRVLVTGGRPHYTGGLATAEVYDPATGVWTPTGSLSVDRHLHTATLLASGKVLVTGGAGSGHPDTLRIAEVYDPETGSWTPTASMAIMRCLHTATLLASGKVLVVGALDPRAGPTQSHAEVYDPALETWTPTVPMVDGRFRHTATLLESGKVLVLGNEIYSSTLIQAELYDPETGSWTNAGNTFSLRRRHTATRLVSGRVLVMGGVYAGREFSLAQVYVP